MRGKLSRRKIGPKIMLTTEKMRAIQTYHPNPPETRIPGNKLGNDADDDCQNDQPNAHP